MQSLTRTRIRLAMVLAAIVPGRVAGADAADANPDIAGSRFLQPHVEVEEEVYSFQPAHNGAGPLWCYGSTCLARFGDTVWASGLETLAGLKPLNNCRWTLWRRGKNRWTQIAADTIGRTREPCPVTVVADGRLFLSVNPTLTAPNTYNGPARPEILQFSAAQPSATPKTLLPGWNGSPAFTEHSYRSFAADGIRRELILFQNIGYTHAEWVFRDSQGKWSARGQLKWPWGADYAKPQPIRVCYPNVALKDRAVHFCGVSDILEPNPEWRAYKKQLTGQHWDYDFRRLFYTWTPDVTSGKFSKWVEVASREKTCGWISPCDLWVGPDGAAHLLWTERALDERLREKFFPKAKQSHALNYAIVRQGRVESRRTLVYAEENNAQAIPGTARFHVTLDNRLFVLFYLSGRNASGQAMAENRLMEIQPDGRMGRAVRIPLQQPFTRFFTATPRAGSAPSRVIDLLGQSAGSPQAIRYARIRLSPSKTPHPPVSR